MIKEMTLITNSEVSIENLLIQAIVADIGVSIP